MLSEYQAEGVIGLFTWDQDDHTADFILLDEEKSIPQEYWKPTLNCRALMHYALTHTLPSFKRLGKVEVEETTDGKRETFWQAWYAFPTNGKWLFWCGEGALDGYSIEEHHRASITITDSLKDACYDANLGRDDCDPWVWSHLPPTRRKEGRPLLSSLLIGRQIQYKRRLGWHIKLIRALVAFVWWQVASGKWLLGRQGAFGGG